MTDDLVDDAPPPPPPPPGRRLLRFAREIVLTVVVASVALIAVGAWRAPTMPEQAPPLHLRSLAGTDVDLASFRGRPVVVNFWATWCMPCRAELPLLRAHDSAQTPVLFVAVDGEPSALEAFARREGLPLERVLLLDAEAGRRWPARVLPTSVFVDGDGHVQAAHTGIVTPWQLWWWGRSSG